MPARSYTYRLTLTPATEAALLRLKECGENKQLLSRCALWCSGDALEALIVLQKKRFPYQVRGGPRDGEWGECILPGAWQAIEFDDAQWRAVAVMQGAGSVTGRNRAGARAGALTFKRCSNVNG